MKHELYFIGKETLADIATAIKEKRNISGTIKPKNYAEEIRNISGELLIAYTEAEMEALMTEENLGCIVRYDGESGKYLNGELYEVTADGDSEQYYTLPDLSDPALTEDIRKGKQAIGSNGQIIEGALESISLQELEFQAIASEIIKGKQAYSNDGEVITGTYEPYELPNLATPALPDEVFLGKEYIKADGQVGIGTYIQPTPENLDSELTEQDELLDLLEDRVDNLLARRLEPTPNLVYTLSADGAYYIVGTGFTSIEAIEADTSGGTAGSGLDANWQGGRVVIPKMHNDKPVLAIAPRAFLDVLNITSVYIFDGLTHIGHRCFQCTGNSGYDVAMNSIRLPNTLKKAGCGNGRLLWGRQGLTSVTLPNNVVELENSAFAYCTGLDCVSAPTVTYAANSPMQNSPNITKVYLPRLEETVSNLCRDCTSLTSIHLPKIRILGSSAFSGCTALQTIRLGADIESIEAYVFACGSSGTKTTIILEATTPPALNAGAFNTTTYLTTIAKIIVPKGCGNAYKTATNWTLVASLIEEAA